MNIGIKELAKFLVKAKKQTYAGEGKEIIPERPDFKELEYSEDNYNYRDSYTGFFLLLVRRLLDLMEFHFGLCLTAVG